LTQASKLSPSQQDLLSCPGPAEFDKFVTTMTSDMAGDLPVADLNSLVWFASRQAGYWSAQWCFSPSKSPDARAKVELDAWDGAYNWLSKLLIETEPQVKHLVIKRHKFENSRAAIERRVDTTRGPLHRLLISGFSGAALACNSVGLRSAATRLMSIAMYPKGTVGRDDCNRLRR